LNLNPEKPDDDDIDDNNNIKNETVDNTNSNNI
jgi:hypothetical protein